MSCVIDENTVKYLRERLSTLERSRADLIDRIVGLSGMIQMFINKADLGKYGSIESISRRIEELENDLVVSSYSFQKTHELERQLQLQKRTLASAKEQLEQRREIQKLRAEKKDCFVRLSQLRREVSEVENAIQVSRVIIDAKNRGETITPDHVRRQTVKMKEDCYGSMRRKHSRQIRAVEDSLRVSIVYSHSMQTCLVYGVGKAVDEACSRLNDLLSWQSITLPFDPSYVAVLLANQGALCHKLESDSQCIIHIDKENQRISAEGGASSLNQLRTQFLSILNNPTTISFPPPVLSRLLWNNHQRYVALSNQCDAYLFIDFRTGVLSVYGDQAQQQSAKMAISTVMDSLTDRTVTVSLPSPQVVAFLVGEKGVSAREMQRASLCKIQFSSKEETPSAQLTGSQEEVDAARALIDAKLEQYSKENKTITLPELGIPLLLNQKGKELQRIKHDHHVIVSIDKAACTATVRGKEEAVAAACEELQRLLSTLTSRTLPLAQHQRGAFLGNRGQNVAEYRRRFRVSVRVDGEGIHLEGVADHVAAAAAEIGAWLEDHSMAYLEGSREALGRVIIGTKGVIVRALEKEFRVRIIQDDVGRVCVMGPRNAVKEACSSLQQRIAVYEASHAVYRFTENHFLYCTELARSSVEAYRRQYPHLRFTVNIVQASLQIEGDPEELKAFRVMFEPFVSRCASFVVTHQTILPSQCGVVLGRQGHRIQHLQEECGVRVRLDQSSGDVVIWGSPQGAAAAVAGIHSLIETYEVVTSERSLTATEFSNLLVDRCRPISEIQKQARCVVVLPQTSLGDRKTVKLTGTRPSLQIAESLLDGFAQGVFMFSYVYPEAAMTSLLASPTFHLERLSLAHQCCISTDTHGNVSMRGAYTAVHATHTELFTALVSQEPGCFLQLPLSSGVAHALTTGRCHLDLPCDGVTLEVEPAERSVYLSGPAAMVTKAETAVSEAVRSLSRRFVLIDVDSALLAYVIGSKGHRIQQMAASSGAAIEVIRSNAGVLVSGEPDAVIRACGAVERVLQETRELNAVLRPSAHVLSAFLLTYHDFLRKWEDEYGGKLTIDEARGLIRIHGERAESVQGLRNVVESILEAVELEEEKEEQSRIAFSASAGDGTRNPEGSPTRNPEGDKAANPGSDETVNPEASESDGSVTASSVGHAQRIESLLELNRLL